MRIRTRALVTSLLGLTLAVGCAHNDAYPPALPNTAARKVVIPWDAAEPFIPTTPPPAELRYTPPVARLSPASLHAPVPDDWPSWQAYVPPQTTCTGKRAHRRCTTVQASAVDQANTTAVVKPKAVHMAYGQSIQVTYPYDGKGQKVYEVITSPQEFTSLILPPDERLATASTLNREAWEVLPGKTGAEGSRQEVIAVRPKQAPQRGRDVLLFQSGLTIYLQFIAQERPGMLSVVWEMPEPVSTLGPEVPLDRRPPKFNTAEAYSGYTVKLEGKSGLQPPWYPKAVVDDAQNTLIQLGTSMEGQRMPSVTGIQQNGKPAIVASRLYTNPERPDYGAWIFVNGLWPAIQMKDAAGLSVLIVRQVPASVAESTHASR